MSYSDQEIEEFKNEALEFLEKAEKSLLALDLGAEFKACFDSVFRGFHNLKGGAGMMEMLSLQKHTHELETILMTFKEKNEIPHDYINFFLKGIDAAREILDGKAIEFNYHVVAEESHKIEVKEPQNEKLNSNKTTVPNNVLAEFISECEEIMARVSNGVQILETSNYTKDLIDSLYRDVHSIKGTSYLFSVNLMGDLAHAMESSLEKIRNGTHFPTKDLISSLYKSLDGFDQMIKSLKDQSSLEPLNDLVSYLTKSLNQASEKLSQTQTKTAEAQNAHAPATTEEGASSIRVPVALLDNLMTLMGEMVLVRNQVLQYSNKSDDLELASMSKRLNVVTSEIQGEMMKTRMQPIGNILTKFNRVVRDLSNELKKNISLQLVGAETELDKSLLEAIKDPLTHIVRNSCDHGIENPEIRKKSGKSEEGKISIKAYHEGGQVVIEIGDDGKGLHKEVLVQKSIEKGLITQSDANKLSENEIYNLIFAPGFSTAAQVTNVSGRGVGMDVVRTNIEKIGGTVELSSQTGQGTSIKIKIPLTLAIVPALLVKGTEGTFAIPQVKLEELVRVDQTSSDAKIEILHGSPVYRLRGKILPLVDLTSVLTQQDCCIKKFSEKTINIAVLNAEQCVFGLIFDEVLDTADIVVKPINRLLKSLQVYSGATILGDGTVALILDVIGISKVAQLGHTKTNLVQTESESIKLNKLNDLQDFLLVKLNSTTKHAIALSYVHRLEEFKKNQVEYSVNQRVIRYREMILPLINVNQQLGYTPQETDDSAEILPVVVIQKTGVMYGLVVNEILDTLSTTVEMDTIHKSQNCIFGNLNLKDELIVVVDPFTVIDQTLPVSNQIFQDAPNNVHSIKPGQKRLDINLRILLAEDTTFFRKAISTVLEKAGHQVTAVNDGREAIELLNKSDQHFDLIVSDIEMPNINGFQLAMAVRGNPHFAKMPMLAISSRADDKYQKEGLKAGFDIYLEKLKPDILLNAISDLTIKKMRVS